jgi:hypothetical protein
MAVPTYPTAWSHNPVSISNFAKLCHSLTTTTTIIIIIIIILIINCPEAEEFHFTYTAPHSAIHYFKGYILVTCSFLGK